MEATDRELLRTFLRSRSEDAFKELLSRHLPMVLGTARRLLANEQMSEDVAQNTFALLAKKGASLSAEQSIGGWLHRAARNEALHVLRSENRRRKRDETLAAMKKIESSAAPPALLEDLEEALNELAPTEQDALVLRFLEDRRLNEVGVELGVSPDAARMRVNRALEQLRAILQRRGITISAAALAGTLTGQSVVTVPVGLGTTIATAVLSTPSGAGAAGGMLAGWLSLKGATIITGLIAATGAGLLWIHKGGPQPSLLMAENIAAEKAAQSVVATPPGNNRPTAARPGAAGSSTVKSSFSDSNSEQPPLPEAQQLVDQARELIGHQQYEDALDRLDASIALSPRFPEAHLFRGNALEGAGKLQEALAAHQRAAELRPNYKQAWFEQSRIFDRLEQYDLAIRAASKAVEIDVDFWQAWLGRGRAKYYLNLNQEALTDLDRAIVINPDFPDAYHYRALVHLRLYQAGKAIQDRREAAKVAPDDFIQHYRLAFTLWNQYQPADAVQPATRAISLNPAAVGGWRVRASVLAQLGRYEESLSDFDEAVRIEPQNHHLWRERGMVKSSLGRLEQALQDLDRAVQLGEGYGPNFRDRGRVLLNLGRGDRALEDFSRAAILGAGRDGRSGQINYQDLRQWRGEALVQQNDPSGAISEFTSRIERFDKGPAQIRSRAVTNEQLIDFEDAGEPLVSGFDQPDDQPSLDMEDMIDPWEDRAYLWRGIAYVESGNGTKALEDLSSWLSRNEGTTQAYYYRGRARIILEQWEQALLDLSRAIELNPRFSGAWEMRGAIQYRRGHSEQALTDLLEALHLNPESVHSANLAEACAEKIGATSRLTEFYSREVGANPENAVLRERRGEHYARMENWGNALDDYAVASRLRPETGRLHFCLANCYLSVGDLSRALSATEQALACSNLEESHRIYAVLMTALGGPDNAKAQTRLRELHPPSTDWPATLIRFLRKELSFEDTLAATKNNLERSELHTYAGWSDLNKGMGSDGREHLEWVIQQGDRGLMEFHIARLLLQKVQSSNMPTELIR